jgi:competence protein ComEA
MPEFLLQRRRLLLAAAGSLALILLAGRFVLGAGTTTVAPLPSPPTETAGVTGLEAARVVVDVVGAVRRPGLYRLEQGSRIADAVARAGGATGKADLAQVNLAAPLADGEQVVVPKRGGRGSGRDGSRHRPGAPELGDSRSAGLAAGDRPRDGAENPRLQGEARGVQLGRRA